MVQRVHLSAHPRHLGWASRAVVSGFLGSIVALLVLLVAYGFAAATGSTSPNANVFSAWMYALANNPATRLVRVISSLTVTMWCRRTKAMSARHTRAAAEVIQ